METRLRPRSTTGAVAARWDAPLDALSWTRLSRTILAGLPSATVTPMSRIVQIALEIRNSDQISSKLHFWPCVSCVPEIRHGTKKPDTFAGVPYFAQSLFGFGKKRKKTRTFITPQDLPSDRSQWLGSLKSVSLSLTSEGPVLACPLRFNILKCPDRALPPSPRDALTTHTADVSPPGDSWPLLSSVHARARQISASNVARMISPCACSDRKRRIRRRVKDSACIDRVFPGVSRSGRTKRVHDMFDNMGCSHILDVFEHDIAKTC